MSPLKKYTNEIRQLFLNSINSDLNLWTKTSVIDDFYSPKYNNFKFNIYTSNNSLYLYKDEDYKFVLKYKFLFFILDFKVWKSVKILKNHFKNKEKIDFFKDSITELQKIFVKEVRKEKLNQIKSK